MTYFSLPNVKVAMKRSVQPSVQRWRVISCQKFKYSLSQGLSFLGSQWRRLRKVFLHFFRHSLPKMPIISRIEVLLLSYPSFVPWFVFYFKLGSLTSLIRWPCHVHVSGFEALTTALRFNWKVSLGIRSISFRNNSSTSQFETFLKDLGIATFLIVGSIFLIFFQGSNGSLTRLDLSANSSISVDLAKTFCSIVLILYPPCSSTRVSIQPLHYLCVAKSKLLSGADDQLIKFVEHSSTLKV